MKYKKMLKMIFNYGEAVFLRNKWREDNSSVDLIEIRDLETIYKIPKDKFYNEKFELAYFGILIDVPIEEKEFKKKLKQLGFKYKKNTKSHTFKVRNSLDRFEHDFIFRNDDKTMYIVAYTTSGTYAMSEYSILKNHNNLNPLVKEKWLEIKNELKNFNYNIAI